MISEKIKYSVVIPVYNEEDSVEPLKKSIQDAMSRLREPYEIIFVNDVCGAGSHEYRASLAVNHAAHNDNRSVVAATSEKGHGVRSRIGWLQNVIQEDQFRLSFDHAIKRAA